MCDPGRQEHQGHLPGLHRRAGHLPLRAGDRLRHQDGRRRDARQGRHQPSRGLPVFDTVREAVQTTGADASRDLRAAAVRGRRDPRGGRRRLPLVVCITEGIPVLDMVRVKRALTGVEVAPDRPELPRRHHAGRVQDRHHARPHPPAAARSASSRARGTLTYEAVAQTHGSSASASRPASASAATRSTAPTSSMCLELFHDDPETEGIIMIGEIGGTAEEDAAAFIKAQDARSRSSASSPAHGARRAGAWATPARSSPAATAPPRTRSRRSRRPAFASPKAPPRWKTMLEAC